MSTAPISNNDEANSGRRVFLICLVLGGLVLLAITIAALMVPRNRGQSAVLPDGSRLELLAVTVGDKAKSIDSPLMHILRIVLPQSLKRKWLRPEIVGGYTGDREGLRVIIHYRGNSPFSHDLYCTEEDSGYRYQASASLTSKISATESYWILEPAAYPRRQKEFLLHLQDSKKNVIATFHIKNPGKLDFAEWQPSKLPQTVTNGPVKLTLESVTPLAPGNSPQVVVKYHLESSDPQWKNARIRTTLVFDATGNDSGMPRLTTSISSVVNCLSPREPAWKLRALVERVSGDDFAPAEKVVVKNVPVPDQRLPKSWQATNASGSLAAGFGGLVWAPTNGTVQFRVDITNYHPGDYDVLNYTQTTPWGRTTNDTRYSGWSDSGAGRVYGVDVFAPTNFNTLDLEFYLSRPLVFDFLVDPKEVRAGGQ